jgi:uncharacterized protein (TIGR02145 family)
MKKINRLWISLLVFIVLPFFVVSSCKKDEDSPNAAVGSVTDIDGNSYKTIKIGNQTWMVENLRTTKFNDGTEITPEEFFYRYDIQTPAYNPFISPDLDEATKRQKGLIYNWAAVKTGKLCPKGWRVPTNADWDSLATSLGGKDIAGGKLKAIGTLKWRSPNVGATNESGFELIPNSSHIVPTKVDGVYSGSVYANDVIGSWWSSTKYSATDVNYYSVWYDNSKLTVENVDKTSRFHVCCILGEPEISSTQYEIDANGLTSDINNLVPQSIIDAMKKMGMPIYTGVNPPLVGGSLKSTYFVSQLILKSTNTPNDYSPGQRFKDMLATFYDQDNTTLTLKYDYSSGETGTGCGAFIMGSDSKFTVFAKTISEEGGTTAIVVHVISGTLTSNSIKDLYYANFMVDNKGNTNGYWTDNGQGRVFYDLDGISEKQ